MKKGQSMKKLLSVLVLCLAAVPAFADIRIGVAGPFTGDASFFGEQIKHGVDQAVADLNAQGGIKGQKLVTIYADDACDPKQAVTVANKMASLGIKFVVGHGCSGASIPASKNFQHCPCVLSPICRFDMRMVFIQDYRSYPQSFVSVNLQEVKLSPR